MTYLHAIIFTLLPQAFPGILGMSLAGKALQKNIWSYQVVDVHEFGITQNKKVDAKQYGSEHGMVLRPDVLGRAIDTYLTQDIQAIYYFSPRGKKIDTKLIEDVIERKNIMLICGKFEGIDERLIEEYSMIEISLGDFILSGGELGAFALLDACIRRLPGVINTKLSKEEESFSKIENSFGLLEYPLYTKPRIWKNRHVPEVLLSGNHAKISEWKVKQSIKITSEKRPELIK